MSLVTRLDTQACSTLNAADVDVEAERGILRDARRHETGQRENAVDPLARGVHRGGIEHVTLDQLHGSRCA